MKFRIFLIALLFVCQSLIASTPMGGCLEAVESCPAVVSIKKETNPGDISLDPGERYPLVGRNKNLDATHYQVVVKHGNQNRRWVSIACGQVVEQCDENPAVPTSSNREQRYLLAASWQPAFCEGNQRKPECRTQTGSRYDATHFSLHGLWPQPRDNAYCDVSDNEKAVDRRGRWDLLPALELDADTYTELDKVMPGVASNLHRHEWIKHGTCYDGDANEYFADSLKVMDELNRSPVRDLFAEKIGERLTVSDIQNGFDQHFGSGSGEKVGVRCDNKNNISELFINLRGDLKNNSLAELLENASNGDSNCRNNSGNIDAAGFEQQGWFARWLGSLF